MDVDEMQEKNNEDEESEVEELRESNHPPSLILDQDEAELGDMEDCIEIDSYLLNKEELYISTSTTISSTLMETTIGNSSTKMNKLRRTQLIILW